VSGGCGGGGGTGKEMLPDPFRKHSVFETAAGAINLILFA
jgi:hypothetical protein